MSTGDPDKDVTLSLGVLKDVAKADLGQVQVACATLANVASNGAACERLAKESGIPLLLSALERATGEHALATQAALAALVNLSSSNPALLESLSEAAERAATLASAAAATHEGDPVVPRYAMWLVANLVTQARWTGTDGGFDVLGFAADAVRAACAGLPRAAEDTAEEKEKDEEKDEEKEKEKEKEKEGETEWDQELVRVGAAVVGELCRAGRAHQEAALRRGVLSDLSAVLSSAGAGAEVCTTCAQAVQNALFGAEGGAVAAARGSTAAPMSVARALRRGVAGAADGELPEPLALACVGALVNALAASHDAMTADGAPGPAAVAGAMRAHPGSAPLQRTGSTLLGCAVELAYDGGRGAQRLVAVLDAMLAAGAIGAAAGALRGHAADPDTARAAASALQNLALGGANAGAMGEERAIEAAVLALAAHPGAAARRVHAAALGLLNNALRGEANARQCAAAGGVGAVCAVMRAHPGDREILRRCLAVLGQLAVLDDETRGAIGSAGALALAAAALTAHGAADPRLAETALGFLRNATFGGCNSDRVHADGALAAALSAMRAHPGSAPVQHAGCGLLVNATLDDPECRAAAAELGAAEVLEAALKRFPGNAAVQRSAGVALAVVQDTLDGIREREKEAEREREREERRREAEAREAEIADAEERKAAEEKRLAAEADEAAKVAHARTARGGRVAQLIHLYESGELYRWEPPAKVIALRK